MVQICFIASTIISGYQRDQKLKEQREWQATRQKHIDNLKSKLDDLNRNVEKLSIQKFLAWLYTEHPPKHCANRFDVDIAQILKARDDALTMSLARAIVYYHPDKIDTEVHGVEYKVWCEEIVKDLTRKYEKIKGV